MSALCSNYETVDEFDPQLDFAQFLKEAKTHACQHKSVTSWNKNKAEKVKADKKHIKSNIVEEQPPLKTSFNKSKGRQGYVSGLINGCTPGRLKRTTSGPLTGQFNQRKTTV